MAVMSSPPSESRSSLAHSPVLVIDDNEAVRTAIEVLFSLHGARVLGAASPPEGLAALRDEAVDLVIQDMNFRREATGGEEGVALFHAIRRKHPDVPIVLLTAWTHLETAVDLVKAGAADYIAKPWDDERLLTTVRNLLDLRRARVEAATLRSRRRRARESLAGRFDLRGAIYESDAMHTLVSMAAQVAHADVPVLITGPNGAGKEVLADIIQANSSVRTGPYVKVNLGALPHDLMEAELFGTEAGAFTGARSRIGRFEAASGGTLFLDELANLEPPGQAKLLRVLQTGEFERLGSSITRHAPVRLVAATNTDLRAAIRAGAFREDLYYRLNVIELEVPPLARRPEDIVPLARHFLEPNRALSSESEYALAGYPWPGNVRELRNTLERARLLCRDGVVRVADLGLPQAANTAPRDLDEPGREAIEAALRACGGVVSRAAQRLGLSRQALYRRMQRYGLTQD